jgi:hypothetical protein
MTPKRPRDPNQNWRCPNWTLGYWSNSATRRFKIGHLF